MATIWIDFETYNEHPISAGAYKYAETVEIDILSYAIDDAQAVSLDMTLLGAFENLPKEFIDAVANCTRIWAHNAQFDRKVWELSSFNDVITCPPIEKWACTMTQAYEHGLPGKLADLCVVLGVPQELAKVKDGSRLVLLFCKPLGKNRKLDRATRETHPVDRAKYLVYGGNDVEAMRSCHKRMPRVNYPNNEAELALYHLDQTINDRGIYMDSELADAAMLMITKEQLRLKAALIEHTDGAVTSANKRNKMLEFILDEYGIAVADLQKTTVQSMLADSDIPEPMKDLLLIRRDVSKASTAKYKKLANAIGTGGRLRGMLQFRGASRTGRAAGRIFQVHNLPSRGILKADDIEQGIWFMKRGYADLYTDEVMRLASSALRGTVIASPGHKLCVSDWANIEGRLVAWVSGEQWKIEAFRDFDAGTGADLYKLAYAKSFQKPLEDVTDSDRDLGKVLELACGYAGGVGAFVTFALGYGMDLEQIALQLRGTLPADLVAEATKYLKWRRDQDMGDYGLTDEVFITCDVLKRAWRNAHPAVVQVWANFENSAKAAISDPGQEYWVNEHVSFKMLGSWLFMKLSSGRVLCYPGAYLKGKTIMFEGQHPITKRWGKQSTYSGKLLENLGQAMGAEILYHSLPRVEARGFKTLFHVHDEPVTETLDNGELSHVDLSEVMTQGFDWVEGLPLFAKGFDAYRYRK